MDLSEELWYRIIGFGTDLDSRSRPDFEQHLLSPFSRDSLKEELGLSTVSRSFRQISHSFLYEAIVVESKEAFQALEYTLVHFSNAEDISSRVQMFRTILSTDDIISAQMILLKPIIEDLKLSRAFSAAPPI